MLSYCTNSDLKQGDVAVNPKTNLAIGTALFASALTFHVQQMPISTLLIAIANILVLFHTRLRQQEFDPVMMVITYLMLISEVLCLVILLRDTDPKYMTLSFWVVPESVITLTLILSFILQVLRSSSNLGEEKE